MKTLLKITMMALLLSTSLLYADVTVGTINAGSGNCYPFSCNDTGTNVGQSIDYMQVYSSSAFSAPITVTDLRWYIAPNFVGTGLAIGGAYSFYWGYGGVVGGLSTNLASNYTSGPNFLGTATIPVGGINENPTLTLNGINFTYNPGLGNLILEVVVNNQDIVPNGSGNAYNAVMNEGGVLSSRAYCLTGGLGCFADNNALVTTFSTSSTTPEPGTLVMFGSGLLGLAGIIRRKLTL